jgi:hypothetical protein
MEDDLRLLFCNSLVIGRYIPHPRGLFLRDLRCMRSKCIDKSLLIVKLEVR